MELISVPAPESIIINGIWVSAIGPDQYFGSIYNFQIEIGPDIDVACMPLRLASRKKKATYPNNSLLNNLC